MGALSTRSEFRALDDEDEADAAPSPVEAARLAVEQFRATHPGAAKSDEVTVAMKAAILAGAGLDEAGRMAQKACDDAKSPPRGKVR